MTTIQTTMNSVSSALLTQQAAIQTVSNNIANVNTDGYTRQTVVISTTSSGTEATAKRVYDAFLQKRINSANQGLGYWEAKSEYLSSIEVIFDESEGSGLSEAMSDFWAAWQDLVNNPSGTTERSLLSAAADSLADAFNAMCSDLDDIQKNIDDDIVDTVAAINDATQEIADLNRQLAQAKASGQDAGAILDAIDSSVTELSSFLNIKTYANALGQVGIQLSDGKVLVEGTAAWSLAATTNAETGLHDVAWMDEDGNAYAVNASITGGKLGACLDVRDTLIPSYRDTLDELAVSLMNSVNSLHTSGYDLDGEAGVDFFTGTGAADLAVNASLLSDPGKIAAAASADDADGDATIAAAIAELQSSLALNSGSSTFSEYYSELIGRIGAAVKTAAAKSTTASDTLTAYQNMRESVSGVSTDEELVKLTMYQSAYTAAAKVMTALDEMLQTALEM